jgi:hypothetical protein
VALTAPDEAVTVPGAVVVDVELVCVVAWVAV